MTKISNTCSQAFFYYNLTEKNQWIIHSKWPLNKVKVKKKWINHISVYQNNHIFIC